MGLVSVVCVTVLVGSDESPDVFTDTPVLVCPDAVVSESVPVADSVSAVELPVVDSVASEVVVVPVESAVPLEGLDVVEVVRWLDKDVVVLEVVDVVGVVRSSKFSESEVSTSTVAVPVELLGSTGSISAGGTATSGDASGSDGSSSSSSSCVSSSIVCWITVVASNNAEDSGSGPAQTPITRKVLLRRTRGRRAARFTYVPAPLRATSAFSL